LMNSRQQVAQSNLDLETAKLTLKTYLGFNEEDQIELLVPSELPQFTVDEKLALEMALQNRSDAIAFERQRLEADRDVAQALGSTGLNANLFGRFGLSNSGQSIGDLYIQPDNQLVANMGFTIPVVDWGRQKARRKTAEANQQLVNYTVQQNQITFEQEIITHVKRFRMLRDQVEISQLADVISQKRYEIAKNRYLIGKISVTDFNIALTDRDKAKQDYLLSLGNFWKAYFQLRRLTLYDFQENKLLYTPEE
ncbi:MAG: TolC family protein, partial [Cyclobacteriaceae bacterium]|nr:TolC family protein [Cyclobacteriaceae bacterium]